jgi:hypothetical protein
MIKFEKILGIIALIGLILKITLISGGSILLTFSLMTLACLYYPFGFALFNKIGLRKIFIKESYRGLSVLKVIGSIAAGTGLSVICIGILFKLQYWKGADTNLISGLGTTLIILVVTLNKYLKTKGECYIRILKRIVIIGIVGLILICLPDLTIVKFQFRNHPEYIKAYELYKDNPNNEELRRDLHLEYIKATMSKEEYDYYNRHIDKL